MWQNIGIFVTKLTEFYNPRKQARNEIAVHLSSYLLTVIETIRCGQNEICRHSTFGWLLAGLTLHQIICFIFSILDRCLDRWPAIFLPGCLASILCIVSLKIRQYVSCCVLSRIPQLLVESAPGLACECSKLCDSPELLNCVCRVLCIRASLFTNPLSGQVPQCLPHLHQSARKNSTLYN